MSKITIDNERQVLVTEDGGEESEIPLFSDEAFDILSRQWLRVGWNQKYPYTFSWMGRPVIQNPEDMVRTQEVIFEVRPDVIVETGVAHGGSLIFYASLFAAMGQEEGRVIGVDIEIRPHNREAIEAHPLFRHISLIEGDSTAPEIVDQVKSQVGADNTVLVILDSCHTRDHVAKELEAYHELVSPGSYIVATDGSMQFLHDVPRGDASWTEDHPSAAAIEFAERHPEFTLQQPHWPFNESTLSENVTHWPEAWLRKNS